MTTKELAAALEAAKAEIEQLKAQQAQDADALAKLDAGMADLSRQVLSLQAHAHAHDAPTVGAHAAEHAEE